MQAKFWTAALLGFVLITVSACGGSSGVTEEERLKEQLQEAEEAVADAEEAAADAEERLRAEEEARKKAEAAAEEERKKAEQAAEDEREAEQAQQTAEAEKQTAERERDEAQQDAQRQEASHRGRGLLSALEGVYDGTNWAVPGTSASARINSENTGIELAASPLTGSTRKSGDFYTATLSRTAPGVNQPERKIVVYTDREKSRTFANHYASSITSTVGGTKSNPRFTNTVWAASGIDLLSDASAALISNASRGGHPALVAADAADPPAILVSSLSASVHGVSGHYGCYNSTSNAACRINVAATYVDEGTPTDARKELATLTITPETGGTLYFDPGGGLISLLSVAKTGAPATTDEQYITFGWWQETPAMADGTYQAAVFAAMTPAGAYSGATGSAEYQGPAVGLYVDRTSDGSETTYEFGEFTATAILRANFATTSVEGDVTNFQTTHGTKNWHVKLEDDDTAEIVQAGVTNSTGAWVHSFLARHANAPTTDAQPIAVTGRFDASIPNVRHIVGAFGAHRTTDPLE